MKRTFFFDIDGTLYDQGIEESTRKAIQQLIKQNDNVVIASGRSFLGSKDIAKELGIHDVICDGGNSIYVNGTCIYQKELDKKEYEKLVALAKDNNIPYHYVDNEYYYGKTRSISFETVHPWIQYKGEVDPSTIKVMKLSFDVTKEQSEFLNQHSDINMLLFKDCMCFVTDQNNKAEGIQHYVDTLDYPTQVIVFGDSMNDISMFEAADISICMGNAMDEVKKHATYVTKDIHEDGIYHALIHYGWIKNEKEMD